MNTSRLAAILGSAVAISVTAAPALAIPVDHYELNLQQMAALDPIGAALKDRLQSAPDPKDEAKKADLTAVYNLYRRNNWSPIWTDGVVLTDRAKTVMARLARAAEDGLDTDDYPLPDPATLGIEVGSSDAVADAEITLSLSILAYARHAQIGHFTPEKVSGHITLEPEAPKPEDVLTAVLASEQPDAMIASYNPPHEAFKRLRTKLAEIRLADADKKKVEPIPAGPVLKVGVRSDRVIMLRKRIGAPVPEVDADLFDADLKEDVRAYQRGAGLGADGIAGSRTLAAINGKLDVDKSSIILANMEQWRWMPRELGDFHIKVNIPEFLVRVVRKGTVTHQTRVVVGKIANKTPVFSDKMEHLIVNPYWNVPLSISTKEMLPGIMADPNGYFSRRNYEVLMGGRRVSPGSIDWYTVNMKAVHIRQRPGAGNALGRIKFMFPNKHSVYLHDTPSKSLFKRDFRAFSHGCVRVHNPMDFADAILVGEQGWDASRLKTLFGSEEQKVELNRHIPVHLTYFTAWVDDGGILQTRKDLYGHHKRINTCFKQRKTTGKECYFPTPKYKYVHVEREAPPREETGGWFRFSDNGGRGGGIARSHDR